MKTPIEMLNAIIEMHEANYGNGMNTHMKLSTLVKEAKEVVRNCSIPNVVHNIKITDFIGEKVRSDYAGYIWGEKKDGGCQMIGEVQGWGAIQNLFLNKDGNIDFKKAEDFQNTLGHWIADAIQQKLEKERE